MTLGSAKRFQADDYLMLLALCFYTTLVATINIVRFANSNLLPPGYDVDNLAASDIAERMYGSKLILVVEQCQICTIWLAKSCLLIMYLRLTTMRRENIAIKVLCGYVAFGFVFMEIFYFGVWCRPFYNYWAVPTPNIQCSAATNHLITNAVFNLTSDCAVIAIGLPMFLRLNLAWRKKIALISIFSLGFFVVLAAILNKVYSFTEPFGSLWTYWYVRESSTALLVANLPFVWTFWRRITGTASTNGLSRHNSTSPEEIMSQRSEKTGSAARRGSARRPSTLWRIPSATVPADVEMGMPGRARSRTGDMSLAEILGESSSHLVEGENVTPYTHPALFYAQQGREVYETPLPRVLIHEGAPRDVTRRNSGSETRTPVSAVSQACSESHKSEGSFL
ncbi:hypothetical protein LTR62_004528 [Meristemomyces frigidus]|uniref:Rhodopsin domain-containing protein n=1 Tax=Meristemomyces frigidus TaxID=1508187 RepID=A0AAN7YG00_9PEZI|nr:hypothetical protein LTR62_004528 [Meristemomyces frigidus]